MKWVVLWCFGKPSYGIVIAVIDSAAPTGATEIEEYYIRSFCSHVARRLWLVLSYWCMQEKLV